MKLRLHSLALAAAALCAGPAHALDAATVASASTIKYYVAGASALANSIGGLFNNPSNCQSGTVTTYTKSGTAFDAVIYSCTLVAGNTFNLAAGTNVAFQKRNQGGSGFGVYPISNNTPIDFMNPATCTGPASGTGTCSGLFTRTADGGISDLEPSAFAAAANTPAEFVGTQIGSQYSAIKINATIFGLAVTDALYAQLQADQGIGAARPSVSQAVVGQMLRSTFLYDPLGWSLMLPNSAPALQTRQINICRRVNGSGTQAGANRFFLEYPYNASVAHEPFTAGDSSIGAVGNTPLQLYVSESSSSSGIPTCLNNANAAGAYAMGHLSLETAEPSSGWKFVRINGQTASRDEAKAGRYPYFFESSCQVSTAAPAAAQDFVTRLCTSATTPAGLALLPANNQNGVMAPPEVCPDPFGSGTAAEIAFCSRVTREGNSAQLPFFYR